MSPETRSDIIPVRLHFRETIPQARQPISHRRVCVNNRMVNIIHFKVSHGDIISFKDSDAITRLQSGQNLWVDSIGKRGTYGNISTDEPFQ
ncbi:hypothetical protein ACS0TY_001346 [Phlomoides rotata]